LEDNRFLRIFLRMEMTLIGVGCKALSFNGFDNLYHMITLVVIDGNGWIIWKVND
jgi:hypothetical protein